MMNHIDETQLNTFLDQAFDMQESRLIQEHLAVCAQCRSRLHRLVENRRLVQSRLALLAPAAQEGLPNGAQALSRWKKTMEDSNQMKRKINLRPLWVALVVITFVAAVFAFPQTRALARQFLNLFRVQQVTILSIDPAKLEELSNNQFFAKQMEVMFNESFTWLQEPADEVKNVWPAELNDTAGYTVRLPQVSVDDLTVQPGFAFQIVVNREQAQAVVEAAGSELVLPEDIDGTEITVQMGNSAAASLDVCPPLEGQRQSSRSDCLIFIQAPSPEISTSKPVDLLPLAESALQFMGMNADEAREYANSVDWTTTLVIPVPVEDATYDAVGVDGVEGKLIRWNDTGNGSIQSMLVWVKDGMIYMIGGPGDGSLALEVAGLMP